MDVITLKQGERQELNQWVRGQSRDAAQARRARLILLLADGERYGLICDKFDCDPNFIALANSSHVAGGGAYWGERVGRDGPPATVERHLARAANGRRRVFLNGRHRESQPMALLTGAVANSRWNWVMFRIRPLHECGPSTVSSHIVLSATWPATMWILRVKRRISLDCI